MRDKLVGWIDATPRQLLHEHATSGDTFNVVTSEQHLPNKLNASKMDDAWFHEFTTARTQQPAPKEKSQHKRRSSLLQQPVSPP